MAWFTCTSFCKVVPRAEPEVGVVLCPVQGSWGVGFQGGLLSPYSLLVTARNAGKNTGKCLSNACLVTAPMTGLFASKE